MALHSSLDILAFGGLACFRTLAMSALNSSASVGFRIWHIPGMGVLGVTAKLGPYASPVSWAVDRGLLERFTTHHLFLDAVKT